MRWQRVTVTVPRQWEDAAGAALVDAGSNGAWVEDEGALARVHCFFPSLPDLDAVRLRLGEVLRSDLSIEVREVDDGLWRDAHKRFFRPLTIGQRLAVVPAWDMDYDAGTRLVIRVDPGLAFGTGQHPTTVMMLEQMDSVLNPGDRVCDIGTGSGILAIAADLLGAGDVVALDNDVEAVRCARANCPPHIRVVAADLASLDLNWGRFDLIVSNLTADLLVPLARACRGLLAPSGRWILGGIGRLRLQMVLSALEFESWRVFRQQDCGGWVTLVAVEGGGADAPAGD